MMSTLERREEIRREIAEVVGGIAPGAKGRTGPAQFRRWKQIKSRNPDPLILVRVDDWFETFAADAEFCGQVLGLPVTTRLDAGGDVKMAAFPAKEIRKYLPRCFAVGQSVVLCEP
jgi:DNA mismatch repair protein MutS